MLQSTAAELKHKTAELKPNAAELKAKTAVEKPTAAELKAKTAGLKPRATTLTAQNNQKTLLRPSWEAPGASLGPLWGLLDAFWGLLAASGIL